MRGAALSFLGQMKGDLLRFAVILGFWRIAEEIVHVCDHVDRQIR